MLEKQDIYEYDKELERTLAALDKKGMSQSEKERMLSFKDHLFMAGLSKPRVIRYMQMLPSVARMIGKDLSDVNKQDVEHFVATLQQSSYSPWTKQMYKIMLRKYLTWINNGKVPEFLEWMKCKVSKSEIKLPGEGDLITEEEVSRAIDLCDNLRDKCMLSLLYESGCRIGEIASLRLGNVIFDDYGVVLNVIGKTGSRKIRLVKSTSLLRMLIEAHPVKNNSASPLWYNIGTSNHGKPMRYESYNMRIRRIFLRAGIHKRCNPHMFRHSRATYMANHLTEFQMNQYFGWQQGSNMPSTYVHLSGRDVDGAVLAMNGITQRKQEQKPEMTPIKCNRCELINPAKTTYCLRCSQILDIKTAAEHETVQQRNNVLNMVLNELIKEPEIQRLLAQKVTEMGLSASLMGMK